MYIGDKIFFTSKIAPKYYNNEKLQYLCTKMYKIQYKLSTMNSINENRKLTEFRRGLSSSDNSLPKSSVTHVKITILVYTC